MANPDPNVRYVARITEANTGDSDPRDPGYYSLQQGRVSVLNIATKFDDPSSAERAAQTWVAEDPGTRGFVRVDPVTLAAPGGNWEQAWN
jgi:hypothetical protein